MTIRSSSVQEPWRRRPDALRFSRRLLVTAAVVALTAAVAAPAGARTRLTPAADTVAPVLVNDPFEQMNRHFYAANRKFDHAVLRPAALGYQKVVPRPLRKGLHNLLANLGEPLVFLNDMLQLKIGRAAKTAARFATNTTVGLGGLVDAATSAKLEHHDNDFGTTLARYGAPPGPYLFLPVFGPSTVRDLIGSGVDFAANPLKTPRTQGVLAVNATTILVGGLDQRADAESDLEAIDSMGTDAYATMRSLYLQNRLAEVTGAPVTIDNLPQFDDPAAPAAVAVAAATAPTEVAAAEAPTAVATSQDVQTTAAAKPLITGPAIATPISLATSGPNTH